MPVTPAGAGVVAVGGAPAGRRASCPVGGLEVGRARVTVSCRLVTAAELGAEAETCPAAPLVNRAPQLLLKGRINARPVAGGRLGAEVARITGMIGRGPRGHAGGPIGAVLLGSEPANSYGHVTKNGQAGELTNRLIHCWGRRSSLRHSKRH